MSSVSSFAGGVVAQQPPSSSHSNANNSAPIVDAAAVAAEEDDDTCRNNPAKWYFDRVGMDLTPSRKTGIDVEKELNYRQQAACFIQDMGQKLKVNQLCNNTAIVYMNRFFMFHSFSHFHRNAISIAAIFLAAKVEEQPRKLEHVVKVSHYIQFRNEPQVDAKSEQYQTMCAELVMNENILLQTLGFDLAVDHPHTHIIKCCQLVRASKDLGQVSYLLATNILHLTTMCVQYRPTLVATLAIHVACKWSGWQIPRSKEGKDWWKYVDDDATYEELEELTKEYLDIYNKAPPKLKLKIQSFSSLKPSQAPPMPPLPPLDSLGGAMASNVSSSGPPATNSRESNANNQRSRSRSPSPKRQRVAKPGEGAGYPAKPHGPPGQHSHHGMKPSSHHHSSSVSGKHGQGHGPPSAHHSMKPPPPHYQSKGPPPSASVSHSKPTSNSSQSQPQPGKDHRKGPPPPYHHPHSSSGGSSRPSSGGPQHHSNSNSSSNSQVQIKQERPDHHRSSSSHNLNSRPLPLLPELDKKREAGHKPQQPHPQHNQHRSSSSSYPNQAQIPKLPIPNSTKDQSSRSSLPILPPLPALPPQMISPIPPTNAPAANLNSNQLNMYRQSALKPNVAAALGTSPVVNKPLPPLTSSAPRNIELNVPQIKVEKIDEPTPPPPSISTFSTSAGPLVKNEPLSPKSSSSPKHKKKKKDKDKHRDKEKHSSSSGKKHKKDKDRKKEHKKDKEKKEENLNMNNSLGGDLKLRLSVKKDKAGEVHHQVQKNSSNSNLRS